MGDLARPARRSSSSATPATTCEMREGRDVWCDEALAAADPDCPRRAARRRAPAVHPLHVRLDREAEGHPAHDRRLPDRRRVDAQARLRPQARVGRLLVRGRRRLGHRPLLHRLRPARQRRDVGDVRGRARLPAQGHLVGDRRALRRDDPLHRADRDPRLHEVGRRARRQATTSPRCACSARSASRSTRRPGSGTGTSIGGERCPVVDTWWQTETGHIMITHAPRRSPRPSRARRARRFPGIARDRRRQRRATRSQATARACCRCAARGRGCCARSTRSPTASSRPTGSASARRDLPRRRRRPPRRTTATSGSSAASTTSSTSPATGCRRRRSSRRSSATRRSPRRP